MSGPAVPIEHLRTERWADPGRRLGPDEGKRLAEALDDLAARDRSAYVVVVPGGAELRAWRQTWDDLGLADHTDLLLLYDGARWEARGWGLDDAEIGRILDQSEVALRDGAADGIVAALEGLEEASIPAGSAGSALTSVALGAAGLAGLAGLAGVGWIVARRMRIQREQADQLATARAALEDAVAHLVLAADGLGELGRSLQDRAVRLREEVRRIPKTEEARVQVARIHQLEDEVTTLQSQVQGVRARGSSAARGADKQTN